jgi:hypothetical protein
VVRPVPVAEAVQEREQGTEGDAGVDPDHALFCSTLRLNETGR